MSTEIHSHKDLDIWKRPIELVKELYALTREFPIEEKYGIVQQMRRAAISVPSNIAEGSARDSNLEFAHFLSIAQGSLAELETQLMISKELGYTSDIEKFETQFKSIRLMIKGLSRKLKRGELQGRMAWDKMT